MMRQKRRGHGAASDHGGSYTSPITGASTVSACASLPIRHVVDQSESWPAVPAPVPVGLLQALAAVNDPRAPRCPPWVRRGSHDRGLCDVGWGAQLHRDHGMGARSEPCGARPARSGQGHAERVDDPPHLAGHRRSGAGPVVCAWLAARSAAPIRAVRAIAVDGKSARGARGADGRPVHLLAAFDQASGVVLGQSVVDGKTNEVRREAPCRISHSVRRNSEDGSWVRWLTRN